MQASSKLGDVAKYLINLKTNLEYNDFNQASSISVAVFFCLIENDTLGNVQNKVSNIIPPHCFGMWCIIQIITKKTHLCNLLIHQHTLRFFLGGEKNNWYHMTVKISRTISIYWREWIRFLIIICYICSRWIFIMSVNEI